MITVMHDPSVLAQSPADAVFGDDFDGFYDAVEPHLAKMGRVASRLAGPGQRDDVVQEALCNAWHARRQFDPGRGSLSTWLMAITAHEAMRLRRRLTRRFAPGENVAATFVADDMLDLRAALAHLTKRQRLAIECYYLADLSIAETAAVMNCSEGTVKSTLSSARDRLREMLR
jgi:RNA polymerase sigma-70 factor (ECF subfamily)